MVVRELTVVVVVGRQWPSLLLLLRRHAQRRRRIAMHILHSRRIQQLLLRLPRLVYARVKRRIDCELAFQRRMTVANACQRWRHVRGKGGRCGGWRRRCVPGPRRGLRRHGAGHAIAVEAAHL
jgi:hypothetical protein